MSFRKRFSEAVIIGSGPSPLLRSWGKRIDKHEAVIRFTEQLYYEPADYGEKFTYGFYQVAPKFVRQLERDPPTIEPDLGWIASYLKGPSYTFGFTRAVIEQTRWVATAKRLMLEDDTRRRELRLTRGCVAACWAIESCERGGSVALVGFDFVRQGYCQGGKFGEEPTAFWRKHNFAIERPLLMYLAEQNNVDVLFAQDEWK